MNNALIILTCRLGSSRLPAKGMINIAGQPLISWIIQRLQKIGAPLVLATTDRAEDEALVGVAKRNGVECYRHPGDPNDVVGRIGAALDRYPGTKFLMRAMGDSPFPEVSLIGRSLHMLEKTNSDWMLWYTQPDVYSIYGSTELPISTKAYRLIDQHARGEEREHLDFWFNRHREHFKILYHEPPASVYFRPMLRLEVDYPQDIELVKAVAERGPGLLAPLKEVIQWLDRNDSVARLNYGCREKTGPGISYSNELKRSWFKLMKGRDVYSWDGHIWSPDDSEDSPIFCTSGRCLLGWGQRREGMIRTVEGHILKGAAWLSCKCGDGRFTRERF